MIVRVSFKSPETIRTMLEEIPEEHLRKAADVIEKFVRYDEVIDIDLDLDAQTATVIQQSKPKGR